MEATSHGTVKTSVLLEKKILEEIDQYNPFPTRKEFLNRACRDYLIQLRRKRIDEQLEAACSEAGKEDMSVNEDWEEITLGSWK